MPQQFSGPVTITGAGNQVVELSSTDPAASVTRRMAVTSNNRTESQLQFKTRLLLVAPLGEAGGKPIVTVGEDGNVGSIDNPTCSRESNFGPWNQSCPLYWNR
jgi:hypothetical protein